MASKASEIRTAVQKAKTRSTRATDEVYDSARLAAKRRRWHDATGDNDFHRTANRRKG